ncbi:MAG TPA: hypothetical protein VFV05_24880 [Methylomirabilota bacterium]|nr:hypothetical protein [Methylomirabilota bacterium]
MNLLAHRILGAVHQNSPHVLCFACLAAQQGLKEHDVRAAALVLVVRADLELVQQVCSACRRPDEVLISQRAA